MKRLPKGYWFTANALSVDDIEGLEDDIVEVSGVVFLKYVSTAKFLLGAGVPLTLELTIPGHRMWGDPLCIMLVDGEVMWQRLKGVRLPLDEFHFFAPKGARV